MCSGCVSQKSGGKPPHSKVGLMLAEPHGDEAVGREIGLEKFSGRAIGAEDGFGSEIAAADGAFHGGGPAGVGPIAGEEEARDRSLLFGAPAIDTGLWGKGGGGFLDYGGLYQLGVACGGESVADFREAEVDDFLARLLQQVVGCADDQLEVLPVEGDLVFCARVGVQSGFVEDPLSGGVQKGQERLIHNRTVEPEMYAGDRGVLDFAQVCQRRIALLHAFWKQVCKSGVGHGEDVGIGGFFARFVEANSIEFAIFDFQAANRRAKNHFPAAALNFRFASVVEIGEGDGGDSHAIAGAVRKEGFPENVYAEACVGAVKFLVESADEDHAPKPLDGAFRLAAAAEPLQHGDAAVFEQVRWLTLTPQDIEHSARDGKFVQQS